MMITFNKILFISLQECFFSLLGSLFSWDFWVSSCMSFSPQDRSFDIFYVELDPVLGTTSAVISLNPMRR